MKYSKNLDYLLLCILVVALVVLFGFICFSPSRLIYDENNFVANIPLLEQHGLSLAFLSGLKNQSPGPLFQFIYYPLKFIGITSIIQYRFVNYGFLMMGILLSYQLMKSEKAEYPLAKALLIISIPLTWTTAGLALTETPTIFFALASIYALRQAIKEPQKQLLYIIVSGILMSITIIGRSPFIMIVPAAALLIYRIKELNKSNLVVYLALALSLPFALFYVWKGLVPPDVAKIQSGIKPLFLVFTFGYTCFFMLIFYPGWYNIPTIYFKALFVLLIVLFLINLNFVNLQYMPMKTLHSKIPKNSILYVERYISILMPCLMVCFGILHLIASWFQVLKNKDNNWQLFLLFAALFIALTTIKSAAQFSTRYPYQSLPFLLIYSAPYIKINKRLAFRVMVGIGLGIISLIGYYNSHRPGV